MALSEGIKLTQKTRDPVTQHSVLWVQLEGDRAEGQIDGVHAFLLKFRYCKKKTVKVTLQPAEDGEELPYKRVQKDINTTTKVSLQLLLSLQQSPCLSLRRGPSSSLQVTSADCHLTPFPRGNREASACFQRSSQDKRK